MKKNAILSIVFFVVSSALSAQTTYTVSSGDDSGDGTLRQLILDAEPDDNIIIPADYAIILKSEIAFAKSLKIDGQGATVKVEETGVSKYRVFNIGDTESNYSVVLENLNLEGGNVGTNSGGVVYVERKLNFTMINCALTGGIARYGGGLMINNADGAEVLLDGCVFKDNETRKVGSTTAGNGGGAALKGVAVVKNCVFENNKSGAGGSAIISYNQATISKCVFKGNEATGTYGAAVSNNNTAAGNTTDLDNCSFISNKSTGSNSAGAFVLVNSKNQVSTITNCTFYDNSGTVAGAIWSRVGSLNVTNCTFAGNVASTKAGGALSYLHATASHDKFTRMVLVNNIFAYNYNAEGQMDIAPSEGVDETGAEDGTGATGTNNIIAQAKGELLSLSNPVDFAYGESNPDDDTSLFVRYETTVADRKVPELDAESNTILLSSSSVAISAGIPSYGDPELVPGVDQLGTVRKNPPSVGSREYHTSSIISSVAKSPIVTYQNPAYGDLIINNDDVISYVCIFDLTGKIVLKEEYPAKTVSVRNIPEGVYIVRFETEGNSVSGKLIVK